MANQYTKYRERGYKAGLADPESEDYADNPPNNMDAFGPEAEWWWEGYYEGVAERKANDG